LALRHGHERHFVDAILPAPESKMETTAKQIRLIAGLITQSDDPPFLDGAFRRPQLFYDADSAIRNVAQPDQLTDQKETQNNQEKVHHVPDAGRKVLGKERQQWMECGCKHVRSLPQKNGVELIVGKSRDFYFGVVVIMRYAASGRHYFLIRHKGDRI